MRHKKNGTILSLGLLRALSIRGGVLFQSPGKMLTERYTVVITLEVESERTVKNAEKPVNPMIFIDAEITIKYF